MSELIKIERRGTQEFEIGKHRFQVDVLKVQADMVRLNDIEDEKIWLSKIGEIIKELGGPPDCVGFECLAFHNHVVRLAKESASFFVHSASPQPSTVSTS